MRETIVLYKVPDVYSILLYNVSVVRFEEENEILKTILRPMSEDNICIITSTCAVSVTRSKRVG